MSTLRRSVLCSLGLLLCSSAILTAQSTATLEPNCFTIRLSLNGNPLDSPDAITLRIKQSDSVVSQERGCFRVPPALLAEKALDIFFTVPGNKVHLTAIATGFFADPWDIDLEDKKFTRKSGLPRHVRSREACRVVFHGGEPERGLLQTPCRAPAS